MNNKNRFLQRSLLAVALSFCGLVGCAGDPVVGEGSPLLGPDVAPLPTVAEGALAMAPPDCAGRLTNVQASNFRFEVASLAAGLVAVVDGSGAVVCVDSVSDVQSDLDSTGQSADADALVAGFLAATHEADAQEARFAGRVYGGDPEPQPNVQPCRLPDPEPQPN